MKSQRRMAELNAKVTRAILVAERLEDLGQNVAAKDAYAEVSRIEEAIAAVAEPTSTQGALARRGAVAAAVCAGQLDRACALLDRYEAEGRRVEP